MVKALGLGFFFFFEGLYFSNIYNLLEKKLDVLNRLFQ